MSSEIVLDLNKELCKTFGMILQNPPKSVAEQFEMYARYKIGSLILAQQIKRREIKKGYTDEKMKQIDDEIIIKITKLFDDFDRYMKNK